MVEHEEREEKQTVDQKRAEADARARKGGG